MPFLYPVKQINTHAVMNTHSHSCFRSNKRIINNNTLRFSFRISQSNCLLYSEFVQHARTREFAIEFIRLADEFGWPIAILTKSRQLGLSKYVSRRFADDCEPRFQKNKNEKLLSVAGILSVFINC